MSDVPIVMESVNVSVRPVPPDVIAVPFFLIPGVDNLFLYSGFPGRPGK